MDLPFNFENMIYIGILLFYIFVYIFYLPGLYVPSRQCLHAPAVDCILALSHPVHSYGPYMSLDDVRTIECWSSGEKMLQDIAEDCVGMSSFLFCLPKFFIVNANENKHTDNNKEEQNTIQQSVETEGTSIMR